MADPFSHGDRHFIRIGGGAEGAPVRGGPKAMGHPTLVSYGIDGDFSDNVTVQASKGRLGFGASFTDPGGACVLRGVQSVRDDGEAGQWHHFAVTCDPAGRQMTTYVDGALHDTAPFDGSIHSGNANSKLRLETV